MTTKHLLVIAGNERQYRDFVRSNNIPENHSRYCCRPQDILGVRANDIELKFVGTYWENELYGSNELHYLQTVCKIRQEKVERQWKPWECVILNIIDFRFWFCDCHYTSPYGRVVMADCNKHD
jgi:hypothetical protein